MAILAFASIGTLAAIEIGVVAAYCRFWNDYRRYSPLRILGWSSMMVAIVGVPFLQIYVYDALPDGQTARESRFAPILIASESILSVAVMFYFALKNRSHRK